MTFGSGAPLVVACSGAASSFRKPSDVAVVRVLARSAAPRGRTVELRRDHRDDHRVERALEDRLDARAVVDLQRRSLRAEAVAERVDVERRRRRLADDRQPWPLALQAGRLQRRDAVGGQDLVGEQPARTTPPRTGRSSACRPEGRPCRCASGVPAVDGAARAETRVVERSAACPRPCRRCPSSPSAASACSPAARRAGCPCDVW